MLLVQRRRRRQAQLVLAERLRFEALVSDIFTICATAAIDQLNGRIRDSLRRVVTFLDVDRGALWQRHQDGRVFTVTDFWQRQDTAAPPAALHMGSFPHFAQRAQAGETVCISSLEELPIEASADRAALAAAGVLSFAAIPLLMGGERPAGVLTFASVRANHSWPPHIVQQLHTLAEPFSTALIRAQSAAAVESSAATADAILAALPGETAILDSAGTIVQVNDAWARAAQTGAVARPLPEVCANYLDACGRSIDMPADACERLRAAVESVLQGQRDEFALEYPTSRNGEDRHFEVRVRRLIRFVGGAVVMNFDVTARRQAEATAQRHLAQLAHLDRVAGMSQLAASLAHELSQPLTGILANAGSATRILASSQPALEEVRACVADIISDEKRAAEVIRRVWLLMKKA